MRVCALRAHSGEHFVNVICLCVYVSVLCEYVYALYISRHAHEPLLHRRCGARAARRVFDARAQGDEHLVDVVVVLRGRLQKRNVLFVGERLCVA